MNWRTDLGGELRTLGALKVPLSEGLRVCLGKAQCSGVGALGSVIVSENVLFPHIVLGMVRGCSVSKALTSYLHQRSGYMLTLL